MIYAFFEHAVVGAAVVSAVGVTLKKWWPTKRVAGGCGSGCGGCGSANAAPSCAPVRSTGAPLSQGQPMAWPRSRRTTR